MKKDNKNECFPLVDESGNVIGRISRGEAHNGSKQLHPVVHLHVFNLRKDFICRSVLNGKTFSRTNGTRHAADTLTMARLLLRLCIVKCPKSWASAGSALSS